MVTLRTVTASASTAVLIGGLLLSGGEPEPVAMAELNDSADIDAPVVVEGQLEGSAGEVPAETEVTLYAWPSIEQLDRLQLGEAAKLLPVGVAYTDDDGGFELKVSDVPALEQYADSHGQVDLEIQAATEDSFYSYSLSSTVELATEPGASDDGPTTVAPDELVSIEPEPLETPPGPASDVVEKACHTKVVQNIGSRPVVVGQSKSTSASVTTKARYSTNTTTTIGVGVSASGTYGSFSASGSTSLTAGTSAGFATQKGKHDVAYRTNFYFKKFYTVCAQTPYKKYHVKATSYVGGTKTVPATFPTAKKCTFYESGYTLSSGSGRNYTIGAKVKQYIGIDLSSKTDYSSTMKIAYDFTKKTVCGTNVYPGARPALARVAP